MSLIYERIYNKLIKVVPPEMIEKQVESGKSKSGSFMDLHYDYLYKDKNGNSIIALAHNRQQNGDTIPDPDMEIRLFKDMKMGEAMSFQDIFGYRCVYHDGGKMVDMKAKKELNEFLNQWLGNLIKQGHKIQKGGE